jgi:hypothetical protein
MQTLTANVFKFGTIYNIKNKSFVTRVQVYIDALGTEGFVAESCRPLLSSFLPCGEIPPGAIGSFIDDLGEVRVDGDEMAVIGRHRKSGTIFAFVGNRGEVLGELRHMFIESLERLTAAGIGDPYLAAQQAAALRNERPRPQLRLVG